MTRGIKIDRSNWSVVQYGNGSPTASTPGVIYVQNKTDVSATKLWARTITENTWSQIGESIRVRAAIDLVDATSAPPTETIGDRYVLDNSGTPHADWDGAAQNDIVEFNGTAWEKQTPIESTTIYLDDKNRDYRLVDDGTAQWEPVADGGTLDDAYDFLTAGGGRTITADSGAVQIQTLEASNGALELDGNSASAPVLDLDNANDTGPIIRGTSDSADVFVYGPKGEYSHYLAAGGDHFWYLAEGSAETDYIKVTNVQFTETDTLKFEAVLGECLFDIQGTTSASVGFDVQSAGKDVRFLTTGTSDLKFSVADGIIQACGNKYTVICETGYYDFNWDALATGVSGAPGIYIHEGDPNPSTGNPDDYIRIEHNLAGIIYAGTSLQLNSPDGVAIGSAAATVITQSSNDLLVNGKTEIKQEAYFGNSINFTNSSDVRGSMQISLDDGIQFGIDSTDTGVNHNFILCSYANIGDDYDHSTPSTNPTMFIHSATAAATATTQWGSFAHDQTDFVISTGLGNIKLNPADDILILDDTDLIFGTNEDAAIRYDETTNDAFVVGLSSNTKTVVFCEKADMASDLGVGSEDMPTIHLHSADGTSTTDYLAIKHGVVENSTEYTLFENIEGQTTEEVGFTHRTHHPGSVEGGAGTQQLMIALSLRDETTYVFNNTCGGYNDIGHGFGMISFQSATANKREYAYFTFTTDEVGTTSVTLINNSTNVVTTNTDGNLCLIPGTNQITISNRLGEDTTNPGVGVLWVLQNTEPEVGAS